MSNGIVMMCLDEEKHVGGGWVPSMDKAKKILCEFSAWKDPAVVSTACSQ